MSAPSPRPFRVPYGLTPDGELVAARAAEKGAPYACPGCASPLVLRAGAVRTTHFAHPSGGTCTSETALHSTAKRLVAAAVEANARGDSTLSLRYACDRCGCDEHESIPPGTFDGAAIEHRVGPYLCDVVARSGGRDRLAVEVVVTHPMEEEKADALAVPWVEVAGEAVLDAPGDWSATASKLRPCRRCRPRARDVVHVADGFGIPRHVYAPVEPEEGRSYVASVQDCFRCGTAVPVFYWEGAPFCETPPPTPRPRTVQRRNSKMFGGRYWANTCASCGVTQGDNFLYGQRDDGRDGVLSHLLDIRTDELQRPDLGWTPRHVAEARARRPLR